MDKATIACIRDARVGDRVWILAGNETAFGPDGKRTGRGVWHLREVVKIARKYFTVKEARFEATQDFEIGTGIARTVNDFWPPDYAMGEVEKWIHENERQIRREVELCRDAAKLAEVARIFGLEPPTVEPRESP
jgi:hypothetical protein